MHRYSKACSIGAILIGSYGLFLLARQHYFFGVWDLVCATILWASSLSMRASMRRAAWHRERAEAIRIWLEGQEEP